MSNPPLLTTPRSGYGGRGYKIPGRKAVYPGVTTILNQINKPALMQYAADQTAAFAVANLPYLMTRDERAGWRYLRWYWSREIDIESDPTDPLREHWKGTRDDRADLGTNIHQHIQADLGDGLYPRFHSHETAEMLDAWDDFRLNHIITLHRSEFTLVNDEAGYAGTGDADWDIICDHPGLPCLAGADLFPVRALIDLKSSRYTWPEHMKQISALRACKTRMVQVDRDTPKSVKAEKTHKGQKIVSWWVEEETPSFDTVALLHIRPDDLDPKGEKIPRFCKLIEVHDLDLHYRGFLGALELAKTERELNEREKSRRANGGTTWEQSATQAA